MIKGPGRTIWRKIFAVENLISPRSFRIYKTGLGIVILADLLIRSVSFKFFFGRDFLPLQPFVAKLDQWSYFAPTIGVIAALMALVMVFRRLPILSPGILFICYSLFYFKNPYFSETGDVLIRVHLFWLLLFELEARLREPGERSLISTLWLWQVSTIYLFAGIYKMHPDWLLNGEAMYRFLHLKMCFKSWISAAPSVPDWAYSVLGQLAVAGETAGGFLLVFSGSRPRLRKILCLAFIFFHALIEIYMNVGLISFISVLFWILFWPQDNSAARIDIQTTGKAKPILKRAFQLGVMSYFAIAVVGQFLPKSLRPRPHSFETKFFILNQHWSMFAPTVSPANFSVSVQLRGTDGASTEVWQDSDFESTQRTRYFATWPEYRWMVFYLRLMDDFSGMPASAFARFFCPSAPKGANSIRIRYFREEIHRNDLTSPQIFREYDLKCPDSGEKAQDLSAKNHIKRFHQLEHPLINDPIINLFAFTTSFDQTLEPHPSQKL